MKLFTHFLIPSGLLAGTIIGAGVFALPYVFHAAGLSLGIFYLALGAAVYVALHLIYADLILRTPGEHRFVGYAKVYFGQPGFFGAILLALIQALFVMTVYLIISLSFTQLLFPDITLMARLFFFWFIGSVGLFLKLQRVAILEFFITVGIIAIIGFVFALGVRNYGNFSFLDFTPRFDQGFLPLGPILFSLSGLVAIPSLVQYFRKRKSEARHVRRAITAGTLLSALVYIAFVIGILGLTPTVSEDAVSGLIGAVSPFVITVIGILGLLSIVSSYIVVGLDVHDILAFDLHLPFLMRSCIVLTVPLFLYFIGFQNFLSLVSFIGGTFLALEGIFLIVMWLRAVRRHPDKGKLLYLRPAVVVSLFLVFLATLASETLRYFSRY